MMRFLFSLLLFAFASNVAQAASFDQTVWNGLLKKHVVSIRQGQATQVNYGGMAADRVQLKAYLNATSAVQITTFNSWKKPDQLAFLINTYNAWTVDLILTQYPKLESIKDLGSLFESPWKKKFIPLLGETRSLDDIEHGLIRADRRYEEPRIHFAVNCASIGCPALRAEAYEGDRLSVQLDEATKSFLSDRTRNHLDGAALKLSPIFKWYRGDFERGWGGFKSLEHFLATYRQSLGLTETNVRWLNTGDMDIEFLDYDWRLNRV